MSDRAEHRGPAVRAPRLRTARRISASGAVVRRSGDLRAANADHEAFWAEQAERPRLVPPLGHGDGLEPAVGEVVRGRQLNASVNCLDRHVEAGRRRQGRVPLGGRARRHPHDHLLGPARRGLPPRERAERARRPQGRPGQHLPRHGARAADRDARVRADRRAALRRLRRLQRRGAARPDQRRRGEGADHRRRRLAPGHDRAR